MKYLRVSLEKTSSSNRNAKHTKRKRKRKNQITLFDQRHTIILNN